MTRKYMVYVYGCGMLAMPAWLFSVKKRKLREPYFETSCKRTIFAEH